MKNDESDSYADLLTDTEGLCDSEKNENKEKHRIRISTSQAKNDEREKSGKSQSLKHVTFTDIPVTQVHVYTPPTLSPQNETIEPWRFIKRSKKRLRKLDTPWAYRQTEFSSLVTKLNVIKLPFANI